MVMKKLAESNYKKFWIKAAKNISTRYKSHFRFLRKPQSFDHSALSGLLPAKYAVISNFFIWFGVEIDAVKC